jgi:hypothetical protein
VARRRTRTADIAAIEAELSDRDHAILHSVAEHHFLTIRQIEALHFAEHRPISGGRIARRVLARLRDLRLLAALDRRIGGMNAGSYGMVHYIDLVGDQVLHGLAARARRYDEPSQRFLHHQLAIADTKISLITADRSHAIDLVECVVEPASWRRYTSVGGARLTVKPDLYAETAAGDDLVRAWFIEVDRSTEHLPTLLKKCRDYEAYRQTGIEQDRHGAFPLVVWSITHPDPAKAERRRQALADAIAADRTLTAGLFRIVAPDALLPLIGNGGAV